MIPNGSNYPSSLDSDTNLFLVRDALRVRLLEDYTPGDTTIQIEGNTEIISKFPPTGIITLTEQLSDIDVRAISFFYGSRTDNSFDELEILSGFTDAPKSKRITNVTMNVLDKHHNSLKDALISIENFVGTKGTTDTAPFGETLEGRTNFLRQVVLSPKAWFETDTRIGIAPLEVCFDDKSFRNPTSWTWNFGDGTRDSVCSLISTISSVSLISTTLSVPSGVSMVNDTDGGTICKTYYCPGKYDVTLTVTNDFGEDTITIPEYVIVRAAAPDEADIVVTPSKVRTDNLVSLEVTDNGENESDPVVEYVWNLSDDLPHLSSPTTAASYSVGGLYDVRLRVNTDLGSYRITIMEDAINVVEATNLWLLAFDSLKSDTSITKTASTYEFGLTSETFKTTTMPTISVTRDHSFLSAYTEPTYQTNIFRTNSNLVQRGTLSSGDRGTGLVYWTEDSSTVRFKQFAPFDEVWVDPSISGGSTITRNWGWTSFRTSSDVYFLFGNDSIESEPADVNQTRQKINLGTYSLVSASYVSTDYQNGADELMSNPDNLPATYRSATQGSQAFIARNDAGPGAFYRISSFYVLSGVSNDIAKQVLKVTDIPGTTKTELQLVALSGGIYVFNNSGEVSVYTPSTNVWATGGPGVGSVAFRTLQDSTVANYADGSQPLKATSDGDRRAYLSYDYSAKAFIKFNETDLTFASLGSRPNNNEQFVMSIF